MKFSAAFMGLVFATSLSIACQQEGLNCAPYDGACNLLIGIASTQNLTGSRRMFVSTTTTTGFMSGIANGDGICQTDANTNGLSGTYKAMIANGVGTLRRASLSANTGDGQLDWVLRANTVYYRSDGSTIISTTGSNALLSVPLQNSISSGAGQYWSGMNADWTTGVDSCADSGAEGWTFVGAGAGNGDVGDVSATSTAAIRTTSVACSTGGLFLVCVEQ
ncbi:MAG: DUF1554 domain-containing protein [Spirochaetales bacterium]|nr:DUF1554 domain-containing protein [Leptospiraceae bacterium]MCP5480057.1 DUF1554 domain-containing protein [Spirochaetales bacterium]MCP5485602.1 DUF1554 domain-containing protein [Spirochaetales bacterium]